MHLVLIQQSKLSNLYKEDKTFYKSIRSFLNLTFLEKYEIKDKFLEIKEICEITGQKNLNEFIEYFEKMFIGISSMLRFIHRDFGPAIKEFSMIFYAQLIIQKLGIEVYLINLVNHIHILRN